MLNRRTKNSPNSKLVNGNELNEGSESAFVQPLVGEHSEFTPTTSCLCMAQIQTAERVPPTIDDNEPNDKRRLAELEISSDAPNELNIEAAI